MCQAPAVPDVVDPAVATGVDAEVAADVDADVAAVMAWYDHHRRDLPWRRPGTTPWGVLVSEVMLQQTPVERVAPVWQQWLARWPTPAALAASPSGEAVRAWGRLGYPRRALRLHAAAVAVVAEHGGRVPSTEHELRALPGVGDYTAAAVLAFGFGRRAVVLDTNVRRVLARWREGEALPAPAVTMAERRAAERVVPQEDAAAAHWAVASMELGAVVCRSRAPRCAACPLASSCAWLASGSPDADPRRRRTQAWHGTDRQCRGALLAVVRAAPASVLGSELEAAWDDGVQRERALASLLADGLLERTRAGRYRLPR